MSNRPPRESLSSWPQAERVPVTIVVAAETWKHSVTHHLNAVIPPFIVAAPLTIPAEILRTIVDAERALQALDAELDAIDPSIVETVTFALLRSESISSSRIEGIKISHRKLAEALIDPVSAKLLAKEVVGNIEAMRAAVQLGVVATPFTPNDVLELHRLLMARMPGFKEGVWRQEQNWIGTDELPDGVEYVPPPPAMIPDLMDDLCKFVNSGSAGPVVSAAIAHAQFEAIHPFIDGNGRVGRCIISVAIRKANGTRTIPPVSGILLSDTDGYFSALREYQQSANPMPWIKRFAEAAIAACDSARSLARSIEALGESWRQQLGNPRKGTTMDRLIRALPLLSIADADMVARELGIDPNVARRHLNALEDVGIAKQVAGGKRNRIWRIDEVHRLLDDHALGRTIIRR